MLKATRGIGYLGRVLYEEIFHTLQRPHRALHAFNKERLRQFVDTLSLKCLRARIGERWIADNTDRRFTKRIYSSYSDYLAHQQDKLHRMASLSEYDSQFRKVLRERLQTLPISWESKTVLCLAARLGTEVKSFLDLGSFAVGIDLTPGSNNAYTLYGDFHAIQFPSNSVDVVFTNSLDHAFDVQQFISEIRRVSKSEGLLILEAERTRGEKWPGFYESFAWSTLDDLLSLFERREIRLLRRASFDHPSQGEQLIFRIEK